LLSSSFHWFLPPDNFSFFFVSRSGTFPLLRRYWTAIRPFSVPVPTNPDRQPVCFLPLPISPPPTLSPICPPPISRFPLRFEMPSPYLFQLPRFPLLHLPPWMPWPPFRKVRDYPPRRIRIFFPPAITCNFKCSSILGPASFHRRRPGFPRTLDWRTLHGEKSQRSPLLSVGF